ncbi:MAG: methylated-DNA--[protein]-cysteine S-methyltransferase [Schwartzia sp. (in: firmicutes)]
MIAAVPYESPFGRLWLAADDIGVTGAWFVEEKDEACFRSPPYTVRETAILAETKRWLDVYFRGEVPDFMPPLHPIGSAFQQKVWRILRRIPYGTTRTYGDIAAEIAREGGAGKMSAQAVGGAVGHNSISILIPCHRVVGKSGSLTGYAAGLEKKIHLLTMEKVDMRRFFVPKRDGTR